MAYPSLAMLCELLDATNRDLKGSGRLHRHPREVPRRKATRSHHRDGRPSARATKPGNLYGAFIEQNVDASRILIVESAFDPRNPTRARRAGASEPGQRVGVPILVFGVPILVFGSI